MSRYRLTGATDQPELVIEFGNLTESAVHRGMAAIGDLLRGELRGARKEPLGLSLKGKVEDLCLRTNLC